MLVIRFVAVSALLAGTAAAQQPTPTPEPAPADQTITVTGDKPEPPKLVCKYSSTGTSLRKRICMTKAEWAKATRDSEEQMKALRDWQRVRCGYGSIC